MKSFYIKTILICSFVAALSTSCNEDEADVLYEKVTFRERFQTGSDNTVIEIPEWTNYAEEGTTLWKAQEFNGNGYAELSGFQTGDAIIKSWLISPKIDLTANDEMFLKFAVSQSFLSDPEANKLEVFVSTDYDGINFETATWTEVSANIPNEDADYFEFFDSGAISLSQFGPNVYIGFRYTGSGTDQFLDGSYQIDDVSVYYN